MKAFILELLAAQSIILQHPPQSPVRQATLVHLASSVPAPVLAHFLRLVEQGRAGVATVHHGVCSGCYLRLPSGMISALMKPEEPHLCENCGCYLVLAPEEQAGAALQSNGTRAATRRRPRVSRVVPA